MTATKIATCCFCGTRAALVFTSSGRHELSCASCGAPLHDMKMLPRAALGHGRKPDETGPIRKRRPAGAASRRREKPEKTHKRRKRKGFASRFLEEALDVIEDIFD